MAYEKRLTHLVESGAPIHNPNVKDTDETLGSTKINSRNLIIYGDSVVDKYPARAIHIFRRGNHSVSEERPSHPIREHDLGIYLNQAATTLPDGANSRVVQTFQRFAGAHLIPKAFDMLMRHENAVTDLPAYTTDEERTFVKTLFADQPSIDSTLLQTKR